MGDRSISRARYIASLVAALCVIVFSVYFFWYRGMSFFRVPSSSMEPTLLPDDRLITFRENQYQRGDIVVFVDPKDSKAFLVKRIVGVPGDTLSIGGGALFINGKYASEPYTKEQMGASLDPFRVPEGQVYVLGDNRNMSEDSLAWGHGIRFGDIVGRVDYIYGPWARVGPVNSFPLTNTDGA